MYRYDEAAAAASRALVLATQATRAEQRELDAVARAEASEAAVDDLTKRVRAAETNAAAAKVAFEGQRAAAAADGRLRETAQEAADLATAVRAEADTEVGCTR